MTYKEALQIAIEELDEKIQCLSDTFNGHSARIESYIYDLSMARKALVQALKEAEEPKREWVGLTDEDIKDAVGFFGVPEPTFRAYVQMIEAKLKEKNT